MVKENTTTTTTRQVLLKCLCANETLDTNLRQIFIILMKYAKKSYQVSVWERAFHTHNTNLYIILVQNKINRTTFCNNLIKSLNESLQFQALWYVQIFQSNWSKIDKTTIEMMDRTPKTIKSNWSILIDFNGKWLVPIDAVKYLYMDDNINTER